MDDKKYISLARLSVFHSKFKEWVDSTFSIKDHTHTKSDIIDFPEIPTKLSELENDLDIFSIDTELSLSSTKPVQNKVVTEEINNIKSTIEEIEVLLESI